MHTQPGAPGASKAPRFGLMLALVALLAFAVREHFVLSTIVDVKIRGDIREYVAYAWNLVAHGVFSSTFPPEMPVPDDYRSPGYPWLIALAMKLFPQEPTWNVLGLWYPAMLQLQVWLGTATAVLVALLARHWLSATWSIFAGVLIALWPHHVAATNALLSEVVFGFCLVAALYAFARAWTTGRTAWWVVTGIAFGYGFLVNPLLLFFPPCLAALAWWHGQRRPAAILLAVFLVPVLGLGLRNATVDSAGHGGGYRVALNFVQGSWPNYHPAAVRYRTGDPIAVAITNEIAAETDALRADLPSGLQRIGTRMAQSPGFHARWYAAKPWLLWGWSIRIGAGDIYFLDVRNSPLDRSAALRAIAVAYRTLNPLFTTIALAGGAWLMFLGLRRRDLLPVAATGALAIYLTLVHEVLQAEPRYATAYRGIEVVLVATALAFGWQWLRAKRSANSSSAVGVTTK
jgi:hypothetical protein